MPVIGITGGIASGKSSLTSRLSQLLGAEVFDADATARELVESDPEVRLLIKERFGPSAFLEGNWTPEIGERSEAEGNVPTESASNTEGVLNAEEAVNTDGPVKAGRKGALGALNRQWLRERVFADDSLRGALEAILHPAIRARWQARARAMRGASGRGIYSDTKLPSAGGKDSGAKLESESEMAVSSRWLLLDIPLLYEVGAEAECDAVAVVACPEEIQVERIVARRGLSAAMAHKMIASQTSLASKASRADYVIWNDAPLARLDEQAELFAGYLKLWMKHLPR